MTPEDLIEELNQAAEEEALEIEFLSRPELIEAEAARMMGALVDALDAIAAGQPAPQAYARRVLAHLRNVLRDIPPEAFIPDPD